MFEEGRSFSGNERFKLWLGRGDASYQDLSSVGGADTNLDGRGLLACDFDDDGDLDLVTHNLQRERHTFFRNNLGSSGSKFLKIRLEATTGNREAVGAIVTVTTPKGPIAQVLSRGAGFASCQAPELIFGLGEEEEAEVSVFWPGGATQSFGSIAAGSRVRLVEGEADPVAFERRGSVLPEPLPVGLTIRTGEVVPNMTLLDGSGKETTVDVRKLAGGKTLYLNFWGSTCVPCISELPALASHAAAGDYNVALISMDKVESRDAALAVLADRAPALPDFYLRKGGEGVEDVVDRERLPIPTTLVLDSDGKVLQVLRGKIE